MAEKYLAAGKENCLHILLPLTFQPIVPEKTKGYKENNN
jgi:hypothetical protein